ncbi:unnamed protein product [Rhodiola kirilowii]
MMEHRCIKAGQENSLDIFSNDVGHRVTLEHFQSKSSSLISSTCPDCQLSLSIKKYRELVPGHYHSNCRISKRITSFDEQYLSNCLELIQISAAKAASYNFSVIWSPSKTTCSTESFPSPRNVSIRSTLPDRSSNVSVRSSKKWILNSETRSKSMILGSPLCNHGEANHDINSEAISSASVKGSLDSYLYGSPGGFSFCSSPMVDKESGKRKHGSDDVPFKDRSQYMSSIISTSSEQSSCTWPPISHGILQCTWRNGIPQFIFFMDNNREVYVTRPSKSASSDGTSLDWTYFIHLNASTRKEHDFSRSESDLVGRMNVYAHYRICADDSKIMETEFVLYGDNAYLERELDNSSYDLRKHRRLPGTVSKFFKPRHFPKHRPNHSTRGTSTSLDLSPSKPEQDEDCEFDHIGRPNLSENNIPSNFELAAIVMKEHIQVLQQESEVGGWGLSFLKRAKEKQVFNCQLAREFSSQDHPNTVERSMNILIPAGYHGGPKTRNTGPSSLIERWRSGGQCDCNGWDTGCPLTVLNAKSDKESNPDSQSQGVYKSLDLFLKGKEEVCAPCMKMVNIQDGLYCIDFQSKLSALQCFSIAVAVIHNGSPTLLPKAQTRFVYI